MKVAFDVDGTLIIQGQDGLDIPNYKVIDLMRWFVNNWGADVIVWSGDGIDYAQRWVEKLGFSGLVKVVEKWSMFVDIAVDDMDEGVTEAQLREKAKVVIRP